MTDGINMTDGKFLDINKRDVPNKRDGRKLRKIRNRNLKETLIKLYSYEKVI